MEVRGRNRKWFGARNGGTVRIIGFDVLLKLCSRIGKYSGGRHVRVGGKYGSGSGRGSVDGKERADSRELVANFFFLDVEEASNVLDHLLMEKSQLITGRAVRRRESDDVGGAANTIGRGRRAERNENGRRGVRHCWDSWAVVWCVESKEVVCMVNAKGAVDW